MAGQQDPQESAGVLEQITDQAGARKKPEYKEGREQAHERDFNNINGIRIPHTGKQESEVPNLRTARKFS